MSAQPDVWRVSTPEGVFETDLETLRQWIVEGCVLPTDKVTKGNLSWIEAGRVPKLKAAFNAVVTSPFALPFVGNLVGSFINATFTFYFNLVVACILGLSLFKCADRLGINVD